MIVGTVNADRDAVVPLRVLGSDGVEIIVTATIDTGFSDHLTLRQAVIAALGLSWLMNDETTLGDGTVAQFPLYYGEVDWHGAVRGVTVQAAEIEPVIGMAMLEDSELFIACQPGGAVQITQTQVPPPAPAP